VAAAEVARAVPVAVEDQAAAADPEARAAGAAAAAATVAAEARPSPEGGCDRSSEPRPFWLAAKRRLAASSLARVPSRHASLTARGPRPLG
jgi:hypothetical protein